MCVVFFLPEADAVSFKYTYSRKVYCVKGENQLEEKMNVNIFCKQYQLLGC